MRQVAQKVGPRVCFDLRESRVEKLDQRSGRFRAVLRVLVAPERQPDQAVRLLVNFLAETEDSGGHHKGEGIEKLPLQVHAMGCTQLGKNALESRRDASLAPALHGGSLEGRHDGRAK